jgi:hypothetical protein
LLEREIWVSQILKKAVSFSSKEDENEETTSFIQFCPTNNLNKDNKYRVFPTIEDYLKVVNDSKLNQLLFSQLWL